jgi:hypothetical protein
LAQDVVEDVAGSKSCDELDISDHPWNVAPRELEEMVTEESVHVY